MTLMCKAFAKKLLGSRYEQIIKSVFVFAVLAAGLSGMEMNVPASLQVVALTAFAFTLAITLQTLSSDDNAAYLKGQFMLPLDSRFNLAYIFTIGVYAIVTKALILLALYIALTKIQPLTFFVFGLAAVVAVLTGALAYAYLKKWRGAVSAGLLLAQTALCFVPARSLVFYFALCGLSVVVFTIWLSKVDSYSFMKLAASAETSRKRSCTGRFSTIFMYVVRYYGDHKGYVASAVLLWGFGCMFAAILASLGTGAFMPLGLAVLSVNTALGVLVSSSRGLQKKLAALPRQSGFFVPLGLTVFFSTLMGYAFYFVTWLAVTGILQPVMFVTALLFAGQAAALTVWLELKYPLTNWRVETDLLHHPRKYVVPAVLLAETLLLWTVQTV